MRYLVLLAALSLPTYANATIWNVNATFNDGATLTGLFDDTLDRLHFATSFDLTTTDGDIPGVHYTPANARNGGIWVGDFFPGYGFPADLHTTDFLLGSGNTPDSWDRQLAFQYLDNGQLTVGEGQDFIPGGLESRIISRKGVGRITDINAAVVPEPSVLAMLSALLLLIAYRVCARGRGFVPRCS